MFTTGWGAAASGTPTDYCTFSGIWCNGGDVASFVQQNNPQMAGTLPASFTALRHLVSLDLRYAGVNAWSAGQDAQYGARAATGLTLGPVGDSFGAFTQLSSLVLEHASMTTLPPAFGCMTSLKLLWLSGAGLTGVIPSSWGALSNLESVLLNQNSLFGKFPSSTASWTHLRELRVAQSGVCADLPMPLQGVQLDGWPAMPTCDPNYEEPAPAAFQCAAGPTSTPRSSVSLPPAAKQAPRTYRISPRDYVLNHALVLNESVLVTTAVDFLGESSFIFSGSPGVHTIDISATSQGTALLPPGGALAITMLASYTADALEADFEQLGGVVGFSDGRFRHLFNLSGLTAVVNGDRMWVGNALGGASNCGAGADLTHFPSWGVNEMRNITVTVSAAGVVAIFIDGHAAVAPPPAALPDTVEVPSACAPPIIPAGAVLHIGSSGNNPAAYDDAFNGLVSLAVLSFSDI
jgi:hypothetical protein